MSTDAIDDQPPIMVVDNSPIPATNTNDYVLLPPTDIPKSFHIGFNTKLTKSAQVENKQEFQHLRDRCERIKHYDKNEFTNISYAYTKLGLNQAKIARKRYFI